MLFLTCGASQVAFSCNSSANPQRIPERTVGIGHDGVIAGAILSRSPKRARGDVSVSRPDAVPGIFRRNRACLIG
jgi:hypothetical protein